MQKLFAVHHIALTFAAGDGGLRRQRVAGFQTADIGAKPIRRETDIPNAHLNGHVLIAKGFQNPHGVRRDNEGLIHGYMDTPDPQNYLNCRYFYSGYMYPYDLTSFFIFENQAIHIEKLSLMAVHSFSDKNRFWGAFMGLSPQPFGPMIAKVLIANSMVPQEQLRQTDFKISRDEWKAFQRYNSMLLLLENNS